MAEADPRLVGITPAMREGSGMVEFHKRFPKRYHDVGIAEQHAVTFAAGMACEGLKPVVAIYSTFLQRAYDQLIHDVALQKLRWSRAGSRGHRRRRRTDECRAYDIAFVRSIPNCSVLAPSDENECRQGCRRLCPEPPGAVRIRAAAVRVAVDKSLGPGPGGKGVVAGAAAAGHLAFGTLLTRRSTSPNG